MNTVAEPDAFTPIDYILSSLTSHISLTGHHHKYRDQLLNSVGQGPGTVKTIITARFGQLTIELDCSRSYVHTTLRTHKTLTSAGGTVRARSLKSYDEICLMLEHFITLTTNTSSVTNNDDNEGYEKPATWQLLLGQVKALQQLHQLHTAP